MKHIKHFRACDNYQTRFFPKQIQFSIYVCVSVSVSKKSREWILHNITCISFKSVKSQYWTAVSQNIERPSVYNNWKATFQLFFLRWQQWWWQKAVNETWPMETVKNKHTCSYKNIIYKKHSMWDFQLTIDFNLYCYTVLFCVIHYCHS